MIWGAERSPVLSSENIWWSWEAWPLILSEEWINQVLLRWIKAGLSSYVLLPLWITQKYKAFCYIHLAKGHPQILSNLKWTRKSKLFFFCKQLESTEECVCGGLTEIIQLDRSKGPNVLLSCYFLFCILFTFIYVLLYI